MGLFSKLSKRNKMKGYSSGAISRSSKKKLHGQKSLFGKGAFDKAPRSKTKSPKPSKHVSFSSRNTIGHVGAKASGESSRAFAKRSARGNFAQQAHRQALKHKIIVIVSLVLVTVVVVGAVGFITYNANINERLHEGLGKVNDALVPPASDDAPFYSLIVGVDAQTEPDKPVADSVMLVRVDPSSGAMTVISIPRDTYVSVNNVNLRVSEVYSRGGAKLMVSTIAKLAGVDIAHYVQTDFAGFSKVIDILGGIEVAVPMRIEDSTVGSKIIEAGTQTLDGEKALIFCRSRKTFADDDYTRTSNLRLFFSALVDNLMKRGTSAFSSITDDCADYIRTDMTVDVVVSLFKRLSANENAGVVYEAIIPSSASTQGGITYVMIKEAPWMKMMERVGQGLSPLSEVDLGVLDGTLILDSAGNAVKPTEYTVTVRNGAGISGCAASAASKLSAVGFAIAETGNTSSFVYTETLVIYHDGLSSVADAMITILGVGRAVEKSSAYLFDSDVLVVVGGDWIP